MFIIFLNPLYYIPGILVPSATKTIAVTPSLIPKVAPKWDATSPITAVTNPMQIMDTTKHRYPLKISKTKQTPSWLIHLHRAEIYYQIWKYAIIGMEILFVKPGIFLTWNNNSIYRHPLNRSFYFGFMQIIVMRAEIL